MDNQAPQDHSNSAPSQEEPTYIDPIRGSEGDLDIDGINIDIPPADLATMEERILSMGSKLRKMPDDDFEEPEGFSDAREPTEDDANQDFEEAASPPIREQLEEQEDHDQLTEMPREDDRDIDNSVISEVEVVRGQIRSLQAELAKRDATIAKHTSELNRLNFALQSQETQPRDTGKLEDSVRELRTAVKEMRAELTEMSTRQQENLQLSEIKTKKELSRAAPAAIIAEKPDVPSSVITPGEPTTAQPMVSQSKKIKKKAVVYN